MTTIGYKHFGHDLCGNLKAILLHGLSKLVLSYEDKCHIRPQSHQELANLAMQHMVSGIWSDAHFMHVGTYATRT
jgi:hypothetical protein